MIENVFSVLNKIFTLLKNNMDDEEISSKEILIEQQIKYCLQVLSKLKRNSNASPFLEPVDPVKLDIPDYPLKIKHPMDLSTIKKKLDSKMYVNAEDFDSDMKLMFNNCYVYNPSGTVVHNMGKSLESVYNELMSSMPEEMIKKRKKMEVPVVERSKQPKRNIKPIEIMKTEDYEFCVEVLNDLVKPKYKACNWPFLEPVDGSLVPGYYSVIKEPMDLQTMRNKLDQRKYNNIEEFVGDLKLVVENCKKFNALGTDVYICGQEFERVINSHIQKISPQDVKGKINDLKKKVIAYTKEIKALEFKLAEQSGEVPSATRSYSLSERIGLGNAILNMNRNQTENIARIVQKHNAGEFVENDEIEVDMRMIPDNVVEEIDMYVKSIGVGIEDMQSE